ncbi:MAG: DsrE family protein [Ginsengibacter sp.]
MKHLQFISIILLTTATVCQAQTNSHSIEKNKNYTGAVSSKKSYKAIFQLDTNDPKIITKTIRNINNALADSRLAGKLTIELIAFSGGTDAYLKESLYENDLKALVEKGVIIAQCNNTLRERKIDPSQLYDFIAIVPSGVGELIIREGEGWTIIKP